MHYRNDWHRYNLKRKVVSLPPVTAENFQARVEAKKAEAEAAKVAATLTGRCEACNKTYASSNQLDNHNKSKKHKENLTKYEARQVSRINGVSEDAPAKRAKNMAEIEGEDDEDIEEVDDFELEVTDCLFCSKPHESVEENTQHMALNHSFYIPDAEYITDLEGLLSYLGLKITEGHLCLFCAKHKEFRTARAVRSHMIEKGHTMLAYHDDCFEEYEDYYDFTSSYPDYDENNPRTEEEVQNKVLDVNGNDELVLPSGKKIGHRDYNVYYKQSIKPGTDVVIGGSGNGKTVWRSNTLMLTQGGKGGNAKQLATMIDQNEVGKRMQIKARNNWYLKIGKAANNQKHFKLRDPM
eukprot:CFRG0876T1